jgi:hypothetical protein
MRITGEKIQWRSRMKVWVGRTTTWLDDGSRERSPWASLGTTNREIAEKVYEKWLETGEVPVSERARETFAAAAERVVTESALAEQEALRKALGETKARALGETKLKALADKKLKDRRARLRRYAFPRIGMLEVGDLEPHNIAKALDAMAEKDGKGEGTILKMRSDISQILEALKREGAIKINFGRGIPKPKNATVDTRPRMSLSDEQTLEFRRKRGFGTQLDMALLFCRDIAGHRNSDILAGDWQHVDLEHFAWMKVRRPKTDAETGENARVGKRRTRSYDLVTHETDESVRAPLEAYWHAQGCPTSGPIFPLVRDGGSGPVKDEQGNVLYERHGGKAGERKADGNSLAKAYRSAVWEAGIYDPDPGKDWDPAHPDKSKCRLQTDTETTRRLDFQTVRADLVTAVSETDTKTQTMLDITGHTQVTTQMKHYMKKRHVRVPKEALPGGRRGDTEEAPPPQTSELLEAIEALRAALASQPATVGVAPESAPARGAAPKRGADLSRLGAPGNGKSVKQLASPRGVEPLTNALGMRDAPLDGSLSAAITIILSAAERLREPPLPQNVGRQIEPALTLTDEALSDLLALATKGKRWDLTQALSFQLEAVAPAIPPNVTSLAAARKRRDEGGK